MSFDIQASKQADNIDEVEMKYPSDVQQAVWHPVILGFARQTDQQTASLKNQSSNLSGNNSLLCGFVSANKCVSDESSPSHPQLSIGHAWAIKSQHKQASDKSGGKIDDANKVVWYEQNSDNGPHSSGQAEGSFILGGDNTQDTYQHSASYFGSNPADSSPAVLVAQYSLARTASDKLPQAVQCSVKEKREYVPEKILDSKDQTTRRRKQLRKMSRNMACLQLGCVE